MKKIFAVVVVLVMMFALVGCMEGDPAAQPIAQKTETEILQKTQKTFLEQQPVPEINYSVERQNVIERIKRWNDPNKVSYIYLLSDTGTILSYFTIKGKVTALNSFVTPMQQIIQDPYVEYSSNGGYSGAGQVVDAPDELGTYGENNQGIFFFLTDGTYMEWPGLYLLSDNPIKLTQQPIMIYETKE